MSNSINEQEKEAVARKLLGRRISGRQTLRLESILGHGSFATVFKAVDPATGEFYAVKWLSKVGQSTTDLALQREEVMAMCLVGPHENIVKLYDVVETADDLYLVLELCPTDLYELITNGDNGPLPTPTIKRYFNELCQAVAHCHAAHVYHRDLKPENILISAERDGVSHCRLSDFGLCSYQEWTADFNCGSLRYMSPECIDPNSDDEGITDEEDEESFDEDSYPRHRRSPAHSHKTALECNSKESDLWALGVILINMIFGQNPWSAAELTNPTYDTFIHRDRNVLQKKLGISDEFNKVVKRMFSPHTYERYTLEELRQAVMGIHRFIDSSKRVDDYLNASMTSDFSGELPMSAAMAIDQKPGQARPPKYDWFDDSDDAYVPSGPLTQPTYFEDHYTTFSRGSDSSTSDSDMDRRRRRHARQEDEDEEELNKEAVVPELDFFGRPTHYHHEKEENFNRTEDEKKEQKNDVWSFNDFIAKSIEIPTLTEWGDDVEEEEEEEEEVEDEEKEENEEEEVADNSEEEEEDNAFIDETETETEKEREEENYRKIKKTPSYTSISSASTISATPATMVSSWAKTIYNTDEVDPAYFHSEHSEVDSTTTAQATPSHAFETLVNPFEINNTYSSPRHWEDEEEEEEEKLPSKVNGLSHKKSIQLRWEDLFDSDEERLTTTSPVVSKKENDTMNHAVPHPSSQIIKKSMDEAKVEEGKGFTFLNQWEYPTHIKWGDLCDEEEEEEEEVEAEDHEVEEEEEEDEEKLSVVEKDEVEKEKKLDERVHSRNNSMFHKKKIVSLTKIDNSSTSSINSGKVEKVKAVQTKSSLLTDQLNNLQQQEQDHQVYKELEIYKEPLDLQDKEKKRSTSHHKTLTTHTSETKSKKKSHDKKKRIKKKKKENGRHGHGHGQEKKTSKTNNPDLYSDHHHHHHHRHHQHEDTFIASSEDTNDTYVLTSTFPKKNLSKKKSLKINTTTTTTTAACLPPLMPKLKVSEKATSNYQPTKLLVNTTTSNATTPNVHTYSQNEEEVEDEDDLITPTPANIHKKFDLMLSITSPKTRQKKFEYMEKKKYQIEKEMKHTLHYIQTQTKTKAVTIEGMDEQSRLLLQKKKNQAKASTTTTHSELEISSSSASSTAKTLVVDSGMVIATTALTMA